MDLQRRDALPTAASPEMRALLEEAADLALRSKAPGTLALYQREWRAFVAWCLEHGLPDLPAAPATVSAYVVHLARAKKKVSTINVAISAVSQIHQAAGEESPTQTAEFRAVWRGLRRKLGTAPRKKSAATKDVIQALLEKLPDGRIGVRDRALILLAYASALRRSELVALDLADLTFAEKGLEVFVRSSKTDQESQGETIAVWFGRGDTCPVAAVRAWVAEAGISDGSLFRSVSMHGRVGAGRMDPGSVARILKRAVGRTGVEGDALLDWGGHSTRAGHITQAAKAGRSEASIARTSRHKSPAVLRGYIRHATLFDDASSSALGL